MALPINPAFAKSVNKAIPDHLSKMLPENQKDEILIGTGLVAEVEFGQDKYPLPMVLDIYPIPWVACHELQDELKKIFDESRSSLNSCVHGGTLCTQQKMICAEKKIDAFPAPDPCMAVDCPFFTPGNGEGPLTLIMKASGLSDRLISFAVTGSGAYSDFFREHMTVQQRVDAVSKIWDMNSSMDVYAEGVRKNVRGFLINMGMLQETNPSQSDKTSDE